MFKVSCLCRLGTKIVNVIDPFRKRALLAQDVDTGNEAGARATDALVEGAVYAVDRETRSCTPVESWDENGYAYMRPVDALDSEKLLLLKQIWGEKAGWTPPTRMPHGAGEYDVAR